MRQSWLMAATAAFMRMATDNQMQLLVLTTKTAMGKKSKFTATELEAGGEQSSPCSLTLQMLSPLVCSGPKATPTHNIGL